MTPHDYMRSTSFLGVVRDGFREKALFRKEMSVYEKRFSRRVPSRTTPNKRQQGVVLVVALFIMALIATIAYFMLARLDRDARRTSLLLRNAQAEFYAQGSIAWAMDQLHNDWVKQKTNKVIDNIPIQSPENEVNGYRIKSVIFDMQARFNINNLTQVESYVDFKRLIQSVDTDLPSSEVDEIVKNVSAFISPRSQTDATDHFYLELKKPYRVSNREMVSISELRLVKGMTQDLYQKLLPYISALPQTTAVNVQTATPIVLAAISETMTPDVGKEIDELRKKSPIVSIDQFKNLELLKSQRISEKKITVYSQYFLVETTVAIDNQQLVLYTLLERLADDTKSTINILWQSKGVW